MKHALARLVNRLQARLHQRYANSNYLKPGFITHISRRSVNTIFELGARDGLDSILLSQYFDANVHAFECNPEAIDLCRHNIDAHRRITLVEAAVWSSNGEIDFYPVIESRWSDGTPVEGYLESGGVNIGASSCFRARPDYLQHYTQEQITVPAVRLDDYCTRNHIQRIDMLCMDLQGAALQALHGLGKYIRTVKYIITEIENRPIYEQQSLYEETNDYLVSNNFRQVVKSYADDWFSDYLYIRND